jgi:hypothetical protein
MFFPVFEESGQHYPHAHMPCGAALGLLPCAPAHDTCLQKYNNVFGFEVDSVRNGVIWCTAIEKVWDEQRVSFFLQPETKPGQQVGNFGAGDNTVPEVLMESVAQQGAHGVVCYSCIRYSVMQVYLLRVMYTDLLVRCLPLYVSAVLKMICVTDSLLAKPD